MADRRDSIEFGGRTAAGDAPEEVQGNAGRPYLRLWFRCANQYTRAYQNPEGTGYCGRCPSCGKTMNFKVGSGGTSERFFQVSCR